MKRHILTILGLALALGAGAQSLTLDRDLCREMALRNSESIQMQENAMIQADLDRKIANTALLPKFDASATALYMLPDMDMMGQKLQFRGAYTAGIQLVQPIYTGGKITAGRKLAAIGQDVARQQMRMTRADVIADADNAYWTYIAVNDKLGLMESFRNMIDTLYLQTETAVETGMAIENDLLRISAKRSEINYQLEKVRNGAELCRMALCNAIGAEADTRIIATDTLPSMVPPGNLSVDISDRPELHLLHKQVQASEQQVKMARADFLPVVGLSLGYTYYGNIRMKGMVDAGAGNYVPFSQEYRDGIGMGMLSVSIPLFHWGEGAKKVKKARIAVENSRLELERSRRLLDLEARQAATNLSDGYNMIEAAQKALLMATENLRVMQDRYDEAVSPLTDLLDAQTQWHQAKSNLIEALTQYQIYRTAWLKANGNL